MLQIKFYYGCHFKYPTQVRVRVIAKKASKAKHFPLKMVIEIVIELEGEKGSSSSPLERSFNEEVPKFCL